MRLFTGLRLYTKIGSLSIKFYDDSEFYNNLQMALDSTSKNGIFIIQDILNIVKYSISAVSIFILLYSIQWFLPFVLVLSATPGVILLIIFKKKKFNKAIETTPTGREMNYTYRLLYGREFAKEIRIFNLNNFLLDKWGNKFSELRNIMLNQSLKEGLIGITGNLFILLASLLVSIVLIFQIGNKSITIGDFVALSSAMLAIQGIIANIGINVGQLFERNIYLNNLYRFLEDDSIQTTPKIKQFPEEFDGIELINVSFSYNQKEILKDISFKIKKNQKVAIVGENGAGKTTLVNCLLGLYPINAGEIKISDIDISEMDEISLRSKMTAVFQDFVKYQYGLRENIGFGKVEEIYNDKRIIESIYNAGVEQILEKLDNNIDTKLGLELSKGQELSGGQWQKIAIARAFMSDAQIIFLDEPTASLDPISELEIFKRFLELTENKTSIMISHRLGPARLADTIVVLKEGKIVEYGAHDYLLSLKGEYYRMYSAQADWYKEDNSYQNNVSR